ncbi:MAG: ATP-binding cassette domain-containing protein [Nitrospinota bacterium]|nr:MAG: ATP-binding cassette domain-containing protein [Nitrospinota bacterium]
MPNLVAMRNIVKRFPGVVANNHIDFQARSGEIHGLLGENGAGKSTLMHILYGLYRPDEGEIYFAGKRVDLSSPKEAIRLGIGMVHQHFMLIPRLTVLQNLVLGLPSPREPFLDLSSATRRVEMLAGRYGLSVDPQARIEELSIGEQQRVEILKALYRQARLLILDEPTAVLTPQEVTLLFNTLRSLVAQGHTVIFISHSSRRCLPSVTGSPSCAKGRWWRRSGRMRRPKPPWPG